MFSKIAAIGALASTAAATVVWDGRLNDVTDSAQLAEWSWSNEVGPYQYYIHGSGNITDYVNLDASYANPTDTSVDKGAKITIDSTSSWNGQTMLRTELIPQADTASDLITGTRWYHYSIKRAAANAPNGSFEHQVAFFESHFTELKFGYLGSGEDPDNNLRWMVDSVTQWNVTFEADIWHNIAYEIDFDASTVGFWHSTGSDDLTEVVAPMSASVSSDGADFHVGVLRLERDGYTNEGAEDWYFSGVYIESDSLTKTVSGPSDGTSASSSSGSSSVAVAATSTAAAASTPSSTTATAASVATTSASAVSVASSSSTTEVAVATSAAAVAATSAATSAAAVVATSAPYSSVALGPTTFATSVVAATSTTAAVAVETSAAAGDDECDA